MRGPPGEAFLVERTAAQASAGCMRIGLTGGRGILGRIAIKQLLSRGHEVNSFSGDVCDLSALQAWAVEAQAEAVLHFAAVVPTQTVQADPARAFRVNVGGTANLVSALADSERKPWLFYASSSHVYRPQPEPLREDAPVSPINPYGLSKRMGEQVVETSAGPAGLPWCVGRIFSFYHPTAKVWRAAENGFLKYDLVMISYGDNIGDPTNRLVAFLEDVNIYPIGQEETWT